MENCQKFNEIDFNGILQWSDEMQQVYSGNRTAQLIGDHVGRTSNQVWKELVSYIVKHKDYASQIGNLIWECKKMDFDGYVDTVALDQTPFDEVAIVLSVHMYPIHICIVMQGKYWTTRQDHDFKHCTLFLAYMGKLVFYSTMRKEPEPEKHGRGTLNSRLAGVMTQQEKQKFIDSFNNPPDECEQDSSQDTREQAGSLHGNKRTLSSKSSGVTDPDEISRITCEHAEDMSRPPPKPTGDDPIPGANKPAAKLPKGKVVFVTHGIKKIKKRVHNFGCIVCDKMFHKQKILNDHIRQDHPQYRFKCRHCTRYSCQKCPKKTSSPYDMRQHVQGAHEGGFLSSCGAKEKWPQDVHKHKQKCAECKKNYGKKETDMY